MDPNAFPLSAGAPCGDDYTEPEDNETEYVSEWHNMNVKRKLEWIGDSHLEDNEVSEAMFDLVEWLSVRANANTEESGLYRKVVGVVEEFLTTHYLGAYVRTQVENQ